MTTTIRLTAIDGCLYIPNSEDLDGVTLLMQIYPAGDCDTCPWPMTSQFRTFAELRARLAFALFDARECMSRKDWPVGARVELPDGEAFDLDAVVIEAEQTRRAGPATGVLTSAQDF